MEQYEASAAEDAALAKLAYASLCAQDLHLTLRCCWRLFGKNELLDGQELHGQDSSATGPGGLSCYRDEEKFWELKPLSPAPPRCPSLIAPLRYCVAYAAEALLLLGKVSAAKRLLQSSVTGSLWEECEARVEKVLAPWRPAAPPGLGPARSAGESFVLPGLGPLVPREATSADAGRDGRAMLYNNLAVLAIAQQDFAEAAKFCRKGLETAPDAVALTRTLSYLLLVQGHRDGVLTVLRARRLDSTAVDELCGLAATKKT